MANCPCKDCLIFPKCKAEFNDTHNSITITTFMQRCSLVNEYLIKDFKIGMCSERYKKTFDTLIYLKKRKT